MASLQQKGDVFYCQFCFHGKRHTVTVGKVSREEADAFVGKVDYLLLHIKQNLIRVPPGVAITDFIIRDGNIAQTPTPGAPESVLLRPFADAHCKSHAVGSVEENSLATTGRQWKGRATTLGGRIATVQVRERPPLSAITRDEAHDHFQRTPARSKWEVLHGWRVLPHSFISCCTARGMDQRLIDEWVGHATEEMRRRYRRLIPSTEKAAIRSVFDE